MLKSLTALGSDAATTLNIGDYRITERFDVALASLACRRGRRAEVTRIANSTKLPLAEPNETSAGPIYGSFWIAPEHWMIEADFASHESIATELKALFGDTASITEQTDAWVRFDVAGPLPQRLFEKLCNVDLAGVNTGYASRTVIEHIGCYLIKRSSPEITVYGPRSSAKSLLHAIETAAHSL